MTTIRPAARVRFRNNTIRQELLDLAAARSDVIPLGSGDPDLATAPHIVEAGGRALADGATHYTHPFGLPALRAAIARAMAGESGGVAYAVDEVVVTPGAQEAVFAAMLALIDPGDEVLVPAPGYAAYEQAVELAGGRVVPIPAGPAQDFVTTAAEVAKLLTSRSRMLCIINPNNPTGTVTPPDEVARLAALAVAHDLLVISDEIYSRLVYDGARVQPAAALPGMRERTITVSGFSKAYAMTGWRIGWFAAPHTLGAAMAEVHGGIAICATAASQHAALAALTGSQDCVEEARDTYARRRAVLGPALGAMGLPTAPMDGAFYAYVDVTSSGLSASEFCRRLVMEAGVLVFPGTLFGDPGDTHVRMSVLQPEDRLREAADRMAGLLARLRLRNNLIPEEHP